MHDAVLPSLARNGLTWNVIKLDFAKRVLEVPKLFPNALDKEHIITMGETCDKQLKAVCNATTMVVGNHNVDRRDLGPTTSVCRCPDRCQFSLLKI